MIVSFLVEKGHIKRIAADSYINQPYLLNKKQAEDRIKELQLQTQARF